MSYRITTDATSCLASTVDEGRTHFSKITVHHRPAQTHSSVLAIVASSPLPPMRDNSVNWQGLANVNNPTHGIVHGQTRERWWWVFTAAATKLARICYNGIEGGQLEMENKHCTHCGEVVFSSHPYHSSCHALWGVVNPPRKKKEREPKNRDCTRCGVTMINPGRKQKYCRDCKVPAIREATIHREAAEKRERKIANRLSATKGT